MPNYLDGNPENVYAINRLGDTFSNAVLGMQQNRMRIQQQLAQQALERAYFEQSQRESAAKLPLIQAQTQNYQADAARQQALAAQAQGSTRAGQDLGFNLQQYYEAQPNAAMHPEIIRAIMSQIARNQGQLAATHPANISEQVPQIMESVNPVMRQMIATGQHPYQSVPAGGTLYDVANQRPLFQSPPRVSGGVSPEEHRREFDERQRQARQLAVASILAQGMKPDQLGETHPENMNDLNEMLRGIFAPSASGTQAKPLPTNKSLLVPNETYETSRGPAKWDGTKFVQ